MGEPEPTNSGYGWSKRMEEYLGQKYNEECDLSVAIAIATLKSHSSLYF